MGALAVACVLLVPALPARAKEEVVLASNGAMHAVILLPKDSDPLDRQAAKELADHLEQIVGVRPEILSNVTNALDPRRVTISLGAIEERHRKALLKQGDVPGSFALVVASGSVTVGGLDAHGTLNGAYELLEQLGVRWYMPGELGTVLPSGNRLALAVQETLQTPSFAMRGVGGRAGQWARRMRSGGVGPVSRLDFPPPAPFDEHPEYYALVDGQRQAAQLCLSNPEVLKREIAIVREYFEAKPEMQWAPVSNHGGGHCQCEGCRAMDSGAGIDAPFTGGINISDRYVRFCNQIMEAIAEDLPDKRLVMTICTPNFLPPAEVRGHPRLDILAWANGFCRLHGVDNPACPERIRVFGYIRGWIEMLDGDFYERGNWGNIAGPGLLLPAVHRYSRDMPDYHAAGVKGFRSADYSHWISQLPSSYVGMRLLWNHEADVAAILTEFYRLYYGPAEQSMRDYHELLERTMRDADFHTGTAIDFPRIYTASVRKLARRHLDVAASVVAGEPYAARLTANRLALDYLDVFCDMIEHRDVGRFDLARQSLEEARKLIETLQTEYQPPLLNTSFARQYLDLFFGKVIDEAYDKSCVSGKVIANLRPEWLFCLDPQAVGEEQGWWRNELDVSDWRPQKTWTSSWSGEGLSDYDGDAWYRQAFRLPKVDGKKRLVIWFGGVDETAEVWLNEQRIGEHTGAFRSFEFDVTDAAKRGDNTVVVRIENHTLDEVGTGGLLAPVFIYAVR